MTVTQSPPTVPTHALATPQRLKQSLVGRMFDILTSIWTGVGILTFIFIYSSIDAVITFVNLKILDRADVEQFPIRKFFELTEFQWYHWWPFDLSIMALIGVMLLTMYRRVPLNRFSLGVWLAHIGILVLGVGSWVYFGSKVEGDAPVIRRQVVIEAPGATPVTLAALPGARTQVPSEQGPYQLQIASITPDWPILSGDDEGKRVYSVNVMVQRGEQQFIRQLLAGYPQYTEDIIPGKGRAVKSTGKKLLDDSLSLRLEPLPQEYFYLDHSRALYLREAGQSEWTRRPIENLPRYHDHVRSVSEVWGTEKLQPRLLNLNVEPTPQDAMADVSVRVTGYLRYAHMQQAFVEGGEQLYPTARLELDMPGMGTHTLNLEALNPQANSTEQGQIQFHWVSSAAELQKFTQQQPRQLSIRIPETDIALTSAVERTMRDEPNLPLTPITGTDYAYRVQFCADNLGLPDGGTVSVASVEIHKGDEKYLRWVADDPSRTKDRELEPAQPDQGHAWRELDQGIVMAYQPPLRTGLITLIAGPADVLRQAGVFFTGSDLIVPDDLPGHLLIVVRKIDGALDPHFIRTGQEVGYAEGFAARLTRYIQNGHWELRPQIVPADQRNPEAGEQFSMIQAEVAQGGRTQTLWLPYHLFAFPSEQYRFPGRFGYDPVQIRLSNGRQVELLYGRDRERLPAPVTLDDFELTAHVGGFTGQTASIRNWTSNVRFGDSAAPAVAVSVNKPAEHHGFWFFQAQWDPPVQGLSSGFNYTVLGVGNRKGVLLQLIGCCIAVLGMIYAFYIKPLLIRRRKEAAQAAMPVQKIRDTESTLDNQQADQPPVVLPDDDETVREATPSRVENRLPVVVGIIAGLVVVSAIFQYGRSGRAYQSAYEPTEFYKAVDLTPLQTMAVYTDGRIKSFESFAHEMVSYISGSRDIRGQESMFSYLDLMFRPHAYENEPIIYVKNKSMRKDIIRTLQTESEVPKEWAGQFQKVGLLKPTDLQKDSVQQLLNQQSVDVIRTAKFVDQIRSAETIRRPEVLAGQLKIIPPQAPEKEARWFNPFEGLSGGVPMDVAHAGMGSTGGDSPAGWSTEQATGLQQSWQHLQIGWMAQNAEVVNQAARGLAEQLRALGSPHYPPTDRLAWEGIYFQYKNFTWVWLVYMFSVVFLLMSVVYKWRWARLTGLLFFLAAFGLHTTALVLRWYVAGRWPNSNMFEALTTAAWFGGCCALLLELWVRGRPMQNLFALGSACASMGALMAVHFLPLQLNPHIGNRMPVLHDIWLYIHTNVVIFSYCLIGMAAVTGVLYLCWRLAGGGMDYAKAGGAAGLILNQSGTVKKKTSAGQVFDGATMVLMELSFVLLWSGIVMGAIWADHSWGRPWGWDPKEVFALNTFIVFLILLHVRLKVRDKGFWTAMLAIVGCGVMLFNWIVINFIISGLHSYA